MDKFLKVNQEYFKLTRLGLKAIDLLVLSKIAEFNSKKLLCYITNKQFSEMFGESERTIARVIERLESWKLIKRTKKKVSNNGQASNIRSLEINKTTINLLCK